MQYELSAQPVLLLFALLRRLREFCRVDAISSHWKLGRHTSERRGTVVAIVGIDGHTADLHHFSNLQSRQKDVAVRTHDVVPCICLVYSGRKYWRIVTYTARCLQGAAQSYGSAGAGSSSAQARE